jgi:predicted helicase
MQIDDLLKKLPSDNFGKGDAFERLVKWWLQNDPFWKNELINSTVKLWNESPHRQGRDIGIDLTAEDHLGNVWAIQAKNWKEETSLPKSEIDKFLSASNTRKFQKRLLVTTTSSISSNALSAMDHQEKESKKVTIHDLRESNVEWQLYFDNPKANATKAFKIPFPHQKDAIKNTVKGLKDNKRGQLIMACGSGKTITAQRIDEELESKLTLVLVPSLLLVQQTLKSWREETRKDFLSMAVCSDDTVTNDSAVGKVSDLSIPVTTDSREIKEFLKLKGRKVIFSTYQSSSKIAKAIKGTKHKFDLVIADEAHRLAGTVDKEYGSVLQNNALPSKLYLFMTATPRIFTANVQKTASERGVEVYSMDDESIFGKQLHNYSFADAIRDGVLTDYRVVVVGVDDPMLADMIDQGELVRAGDIDTDAKTLASHIGLAKAMRDYKLNRVISFHSRIKSAKDFAESHPRIREWMKEPNIRSTNLTTLTISGQDSSDARKRVLDQLKEVDIKSQGLVTNARCLTEGVDVPTLDGIAFIDPKVSQVDIVQAVGRAIRRGGNEKKFGYIVIPIFIPRTKDFEKEIDQTAFKPVWQVINALRSHDKNLVEKIDLMRTQIGMGELKDSKIKKLEIVLPKNIDIKIVDQIQNYIVQGASESWYEWYGRVVRYIQIHNFIPTYKIIDFDGKKLGQWVASQRQQKNTMTEDKKSKLESLVGWSWNTRITAWDKGFNELLEFSEHFGTSKVPLNFLTKSGMNLDQWVKGQKSMHKKGKLPLERVKKLESINDWLWFGSALDEMFENGFSHLEDYYKEFGSALVKYTYVCKDGFNLGTWVMTQRVFQDKGKFSDEKIQRFKKFHDWKWAGQILDDNFREGIKGVKEYNKEHKHSKVPYRYVTKTGFRLGSWVSSQRNRKQRGTLPKENIKELESIPGWLWRE